MRQFMLIILSAIAVMLSGCINPQESASNKSQLASCKMACSKQLDTCYSSCDNGCEQCVGRANMAADRHYDEFVHQQIVQGGLISRNLNSYRDPLQCVKTTCNCRADFHQCMEACTGIIHKRLQAPLKCC